jgi:hypothetical protein
MPKINRKTADPEILQAYEQLRFERRYPKLGRMTNIIRLLAYAGIIPVFFVPETMRVPWLVAWGVVAVVVIPMELMLLVAWQPRGRRLQAGFIIFGILITVVFMAAGFYYLMDRWMASLG